MKRQIIRLCAVVTLLFGTITTCLGGDFKVGEKTFLLNGEPFVVKAAELHYPRIPRPYWEHRIQMCKALGMNTICLYVFWNIHEQQEDVFDFTGNNDVAEFCRLCQKNDMRVIVRPGPYVCAEWEMGGLPWWLLKKKDIKLREKDEYFMERVRVFERQVGKQLAPLTIQNGGPIIMVQVENEYGSYGTDKEYVSAIRDIVKESGFQDVTLFQCDWSSNFTNNGLDDLVWTMNFGTGANVDAQFRKLGDLRPSSPQMCSEFWSGWFDKWGARHETRDAKAMVDGINEMLSKNISFSLYMTHGGTSFGHWAGANSPGFAPDVTSYDYDAPINEWGLATEKYYTLRETMQKYSTEKLPDVPKPVSKIISVPEFELSEFAPLSAGISKSFSNKSTMTFEEMNMGWGTMVYETSLPEINGNSLLTINECHDFGQVFINGRYIGKVDRVKNEKSVVLPSLKKGDKLTIVVEGMGRINFGRAIKDFKGITEEVFISTEVDGHNLKYTLNNWKMSCLPDDYATVKAAFGKTGDKLGLETKAGFYRGTFNLKKTGDTFLNMESFGKGQVYVNGYAIGRYWNIGPQQTLYVPGCWLKEGENEVIVFDVVGPKSETKAHCAAKHEVDKLNLDKPNIHRKEGETLDTSTLPVAMRGTFRRDNGWQTVRFSQTKKGRYIAIEGLSTYDGGAQVSIAEVYALDANGQRLSRESWTVKYADSENIHRANNTADKIFDLQESTYWQTAKGVDLPHVVVIDLGEIQSVSGLEYLPRAEQGAPNGIKEYKIYVY